MIRGSPHKYFVLDEKPHELLTIHERDRSFVWLNCLINCALTKIAGSNYQALIVDSEATSDLLHNRGLDILLPSFDLNRHLHPNHISNDQSPINVNTPISALGRDS